MNSATRAKIVPGCFWSVMGLFLISVVIGRSQHEGPEPRLPEAPRLVWARGMPHNLWLEPDTGATVALNQTNAQSDELELASISPWHGDRNAAQVVGLLKSWTAGDATRSRDGLYLARFVVPEMTLLDQVPVPNIPSCPPCWFPDLTARVIFTALDGLLYVHAFEPIGRSPADKQPQPVAWLTNPRTGATEQPSVVQDVSWPREPRFGQRLLATVRLKLEGRVDSFGPARLWWLQLDEDGRSVQDCGPLAPNFDVDGDQRAPTLGVTPDGRFMLAYLSKRKVEADWELWLAPLEFDPQTGNPIARFDQARVLADRCLATAPVFSEDGCWLTYVQSTGIRKSRVARLRVNEALAQVGSSSVKS